VGQPVQDPTWKDVLSDPAWRLYSGLLRWPINEATMTDLQELAGCVSKTKVTACIEELADHGLVSFVED